jgi:uncharacterized protein YkwD
MGSSLAIALALFLVPASCSQGVPEAKDEDLAPLELRMAELVNVERDARGIAPLSFSPDLARVAREYSARMAAARQVNHNLSRPVEERIRDVRPSACTFGENVSKHSNIDYSLGDLMLSPGHRSNLLNGQFTEIGIGIVRGEDGFLYITQVFTRPCDERARNKIPKSKERSKG